MRDLNYQLKQLCRKHEEGGFATRRDREYTLSLIADQLWEAGYKHLRVKELKGRHVNALVARWTAEELNPGTIKNRMSVLRWWARKTGRNSVIDRENARYGIPTRVYVNNESKAIQISTTELNKVRDFHVRMSLELQREFGLRREEAIKFRPAYADKGDKIVLKSSWTKGGKPRAIPVRTEAQRELLAQLHQAVGQQSLIPSGRRYVQQLHVYERETARVGLNRMHGLRHAYAQRRYRALTSWKGPGRRRTAIKRSDAGAEDRRPGCPSDDQSGIGPRTRSDHTRSI